MLKRILWTLLIGIFLVSLVSASDQVENAEFNQAVWQRFEASSSGVSSLAKEIKEPGKLEGMLTLLEEDFEGEFPGNNWTVWSGFSKEFRWGKVDTPVYRGEGALWCGVSPNDYPFTKDWDETVFHSPKSIEIPDDLVFKWITLEFYLNLIIPPRYMYYGDAEGNLIVSFIVYKKDGSKELYSKRFNQSTDGYELQVIDLSEFVDCSEISRVWFEFAYRTKRDVVPAGVGAWIDDLKLRTHYWNEVKANFEASPLAGKAPLEVTFENDAEGAPNHFQWDFGDGNSVRYREAYNVRTPQVNSYEDEGLYDVSFTCWNEAYEATIEIPNLIYVDPELDYLPLVLKSSGETYPTEDWTNAIDHDIWGYGCMASGVKDDAWAVFIMEDEEPKLVSKIRLLNDVAGERQWRTNCAEDLVISLSLTGDFEGEEEIFEYTCTELRGDWDEVEIQVDDEPVLAKYVKIEILTAKGSGAKWRELVEMQVLGTDPDEEPEAPTSELTAAKLPVEYNSVRNYPNPFNPATTIRFQLNETSEVKLSIFNLQGQLVKTLASSELGSGIHNFNWDGRNSQGIPVAGGVFFYKLQLSNNSKPMQVIKKMTLIK